MATVASIPSSQLGALRRARLREMLDLAYGERFSDADWEHALGGLHFVIFDGEEIVSHASVVRRALMVEDRSFDTGFVEAVATASERRGRGHASAIMRAAGEYIRANYELGSLCTGKHAFYEALGWERWQGSTFVRQEGRWVPTPEEDDAVMILRTPSLPPIDLSARISCAWRIGDVW